MSSKSIRLFRNDSLESLTHVHPIVPLLFWSPVVVFLLWRSLFVHDLPAIQVALVAIPGLVVWSLLEYLLHRFVFHFDAATAAGRWLVYLFHGVHHDAPNDKSRLVMPPAGAVIIMAVLWSVFVSVLPAPWAEPFCASFIVGYLIYDYLHFATHHFRMRHRWLQSLKRHHMQHHFSATDAKYGVSSPLWDWVFGTLH
ncbi:MAG: sterol desaturase family protein [Gammaproteobacteria bacterium]